MPRLKQLKHEHTVYFFYAAGGELIYVGVTSKGHWRLNGHRGKKDWFALVERAEFQHFATRDEAELIEQAYIRVRKPKYNRYMKGQNPTLYDLSVV